MKNNIEINGGGSLVSGQYHDVEINGSCKILGDIECFLLEVNGSCKSEGSINADSVDVNGSFSCDGNIKANGIEINGSFKSGEYNIYGEKIEINGSLVNKKELNGESIEINGKIDVQDLVGNTIVINKNVGGIFKHFLNFKAGNRIKGNAESIACSDLYASGLKCKDISAENIELRNGCYIDNVHCMGQLTMDDSCVVNHIEGACKVVTD